MSKTLTTSFLALAAVLMLATGALAQSTMIKGKVVDGQGQPIVGAAVVIEFKGGTNRKFQTKSDKRGEFVQLLTESGDYMVTASADKVGTRAPPVRVRLGAPADVTITLTPGAGAADPAKAAANKMFDEGVAASRAGDHDTAIASFTEAAKASPDCSDCYYNLGFVPASEEGREAGGRVVEEGPRAEARQRRTP